MRAFPKTKDGLKKLVDKLGITHDSATFSAGEDRSIMQARVLAMLSERRNSSLWKSPLSQQLLQPPVLLLRGIWLLNVARCLKNLFTTFNSRGSNSAMNKSICCVVAHSAIAEKLAKKSTKLFLLFLLKNILPPIL